MLFEEVQEAFAAGKDKVVLRAKFNHSKGIFK
jgi:hypothetical protein